MGVLAEKKFSTSQVEKYAKINKELLYMEVNTKYFFLFSMTLINNWFSKAKIFIINFEVASIYKGKMYKNNIKEEIEVYCYKFLKVYIKYCFMNVNHDKIKIYIENTMTTQRH